MTGISFCARTFAGERAAAAIEAKRTRRLIIAPGRVGNSLSVQITLRLRDLRVLSGYGLRPCSTISSAPHGCGCPRNVWFWHKADTARCPRRSPTLSESTKWKPLHDPVGMLRDCRIFPSS
jgi:hypothetical protein